MTDRLNTAIIQAWREAADDLGITFIASFTIQTTDGTIVTVEGFLPDFGSPDGMVILDFERQVRSKISLYASGLGEVYRSYNRAHFIEALDDWGWFGPKGAPPDWYGGFV